MSVQAEHHCWRIRKGVAASFFLILIPFVVMLVQWSAGVQDGESASDRYVKLIVATAAFPVFGFMYAYGLLLAFTISREGVTLEYPFRKEVLPLSAIKDVVFLSCSWPFCRDHRVAIIRMENSKLGLITVRESWFHCEPGEVERVLRAYYPDAMEASEARRVSLAEVAGVSCEAKAEGDALPVGISVRRRFNDSSHWFCRVSAVTLMCGCAYVGNLFLRLGSPELPASWVGAAAGWLGALWLLWRLCFREVLEIDISPKGIGFRYPIGSSFFAHDAIKRVYLSVLNRQAGRATTVAVRLRIRGRLASVHLLERLGSDVIKALVSNFADVCDAHKAGGAMRMLRAKSLSDRRAARDGVSL